MQVATDHQTRPADFVVNLPVLCNLTYTHTVAIYCYYSAPKANTDFAIPWSLKS